MTSKEQQAAWDKESFDRMQKASDDYNAALRHLINAGRLLEFNDEERAQLADIAAAAHRRLQQKPIRLF